MGESPCCCRLLKQGSDKTCRGSTEAHRNKPSLSQRHTTGLWLPLCPAALLEPCHERPWALQCCCTIQGCLTEGAFEQSRGKQRNAAAAKCVTFPASQCSLPIPAPAIQGSQCCDDQKSITMACIMPPPVPACRSWEMANVPLHVHELTAQDVTCAGKSALRRTASAGDFEHLSLAPEDTVGGGPGLGAGGHQPGRAGKKGRPRGQGGPPSGAPVVSAACPSLMVAEQACAPACRMQDNID